MHCPSTIASLDKLTHVRIAIPRDSAGQLSDFEKATREKKCAKTDYAMIASSLRKI